MTGCLRAAVCGAIVLLVTSCSVLGDSTLGELVTFEKLEAFDHPITAAELSAGQQPQEVMVSLRAEDISDLPPLADDVRRFAFIDTGCRQDSAQLVVADGVLDSQLLEGGSLDYQTNCAQAVYFLSVFDVAVGDLPDAVRLP